MQTTDTPKSQTSIWNIFIFHRAIIQQQNNILIVPAYVCYYFGSLTFLTLDLSSARGLKD